MGSFSHLVFLLGAVLKGIRDLCGAHGDQKGVERSMPTFSFPLLPGEGCVPWEGLWALIYCLGKRLGGLLGEEKGKCDYENPGNVGKEGEEEFHRGRARQ